MDKLNYSLCIPYINCDDKIDSRVWRVADYDTEKKHFIQAEYTTKDDSSNNDVFAPRKISARPHELTPYKAEVREWRSEEAEDGRYRVLSEKISIDIFEILFTGEIDLNKHNTDADIRKILQSGISVVDGLEEVFLIAVNKSNKQLELIECRKKAFVQFSNALKIQKTCKDMMRAYHNFSLITINIEDIVTTEELNIYMNANTKAPIRHFYRYTVLPRSERKFFLREITDYGEAFISKYFKNKRELLKITKNDVNRMTNMIREALANKEETEEFFSVTQFEKSDITYALKSICDDVVELYAQQDDFSQIVEKCLFQNKTVFENCMSIAKKEWLLDRNEEKDDIILSINSKKDELNNLNTELSELTLQIENEKDNIRVMESQNNALNTEYINIILEKEKIHQDIQIELSKFKTEIVHTVALTAIVESKGAVQTAHPMPIVSVSVPCIETETLTICKIDDLIDGLNDNLTIIGINKNVSFDLSLFILSAISNKKQIVLTGGINKEIADSISMLIQNKTATNVFFPLGFIDVADAVDIINKIDSDVVFIEQVLDCYNETLFLSIVKNCRNKVLLFSCETEETFEKIPSYVWNYAIAINTENIINIPSFEVMGSGVYELENIYTSLNTEIYKNAIFSIDIFFQHKTINKNLQLELAKNIATASLLRNRTHPVGFSILNQIKIISKYNKLDTFANCINTFNLSEEVKNFLSRGRQDE